MPTPNFNLILQAIAVVTNQLVNGAPQIVNWDFGNPTLPFGAALSTGGQAVYYDPFFQAGVGGLQVSLPVNTIFAMAVQNLSPTNNLKVIYTPVGVGSTNITVGPGGLIIIMDPTETGSGISAVSLQGIGGTVPAAVLVAA